MNHELQRLKSFLQQEIVPVANNIDSDSQALQSALKKMGDRSWLALKASPELGGMGLSSVEYRSWQISMARASGALAFLQAQHQSAVAKLADSSNKALQAEFLTQVARGDILLGVAFSHLRRQEPVMQATKTTGGYLLTGAVPWITGYNFFDYFILGATLTDGSELYAILPFKQGVQESGGEIICSKPMKLLAASATNTVSAKINHWFLTSDRVLSINPPGTIHRSSRQNVLNQGFFALGCAYAGLDILQAIAEQKQLNFIESSWQSLSQEVGETAAKIISFLSDDGKEYQEKLQLRIQTINLAQRCSLAAVIAAAGGANYADSSAARVYREALLFSVSGQTTDVMQTSLEQLIANK